MKPYPQLDNFQKLRGQLAHYFVHKHEYGATEVGPLLARTERALARTLADLKRLPGNRTLARQEPDALASIRQLRPPGPRRLWPCLETAVYRPRLAGALLGRFAGCTLGAAVELKPVTFMENLAKENGIPFPPRDYWPRVPNPYELRYGLSPRLNFTRTGMNGVPADDDIAYTLLGLLIAEEFGPDFTVDDVGRAWVKYLPHACTAEDAALRNLKRGVPARRAALRDNPFCEWIGADIRADPWGYLAPGWPEKAAELACRDAYLSHRRNGIYGAMFFAAAIAAAFAVDDPVDALRIGLTEIPRDCATARAVRWALQVAPRIRSYRQARAAVDKRFAGMSSVHTINNACLTVWGLTIGGKDFTRVIGETVAMGLDNDCNAATAGSILGAVIGRAGVPRHWSRRFHNTVHSYLIGHRRFAITGLLRRFERQAGLMHRSEPA